MLVASLSAHVATAATIAQGAAAVVPAVGGDAGQALAVGVAEANTARADEARCAGRATQGPAAVVSDGAAVGSVESAFMGVPIRQWSVVTEKAQEAGSQKQPWLA